MIADAVRDRVFPFWVGLGDFDGGGLFVEGNSYGVRYAPLEFDGWKQLHWTAPIDGERYSLVWFTPAATSSSVGTTDEMVKRHDKKMVATTGLHDHPPLRYQKKSTDVLVLAEMLDEESGCVYKRHPGFSLMDHRSVLNVGAHIGVFSQYALSCGCARVTAYEPEPSNAALLRENVTPSRTSTGATEESDDDGPVVEVIESAVANGDKTVGTLVRARNRNDGTENTWRHSLEEHSQYFDKSDTERLPSPTQENVLTRVEVPTVPLFDSSRGGRGALNDGVTFVKMDCEGAEVDILLSPAAGRRESWRDVTHLVFEWSFTKEKRVERFHAAVRNLEGAGFEVGYDGKGSWWDTERDIMWPFRTDILVFAKRQVGGM